MRQAEAETSREDVGRAASRVSAATLASRILGLGREAVSAALLGAKGEASAFVMAFRIPNLLRDFFAEGALASAFVPTFAAVRARDGDERAFLLARRTLGTLGLLTSVLALLGIVFAPEVVSVVAWDAQPDTRALTVSLTRILFPFLPLVAAAAVAMGVLNTHRRYFLPALAPAFFNVVAILGGLVLLALHWNAPERLESAAKAWAALAVAGGAAQFLVQVPLLRRVGWRGGPRLDLALRDPGLRTVARRMTPIVLALAGTNVMLVIVTALASRDDRWPAWLNYAFRLVHLPIGLIGVALGTVVLSAGARRAAAGDAAGVDRLVGRALGLNWFLALPAAVGLAALAEPILRMIYQQGRFDAGDTEAVAAALRMYAVGIVFYAGVKAAAPLFLARGETRPPVLCSLAGIGATIALALATIEPWGYRGLAFAVSGGAATNYLLLRLLGRRFYGSGSAPSLALLLRIGAAAALLGVLAWAGSTWSLLGDAGAASRLVRTLATLGLIALLGGIYVVVAAWLGVMDARTALSWISRRWRRRVGG